ncbi:MAG: hypothetical protein DRI44_07510 [Chlamydiae bacterium]|nr:MAG: hypothetical protein DRI44_07510 [Chlamydiota bacterium]
MLRSGSGDKSVSDRIIGIINFPLYSLFHVFNSFVLLTKIVIMHKIFIIIMTLNLIVNYQVINHE